jgi:hypothetical protein
LPFSRWDWASASTQLCLRSSTRCFARSPLKDPEAVVRLNYISARSGKFSFPDYLYFRDQTKVFSALVAHGDERFLLGVEDAEEPQEIRGEFVSGNFFSELDGEAILGRTFAPEESDTPGKDPVVVLSHRFWQRRFAGDPNIVGRTILLNGKPFTVIGVTEPEFTGLSSTLPELWLPMTMRSEMATVGLYTPTLRGVPPAREDWFGKRDLQWLSMVGRLKPGKTLEEARAEMEEVIADNGWVKSIRETAWMATDLGLLALLLAAIGIYGVMAYAVAQRRREIGIRMALGANRRDVLRLILGEGLWLVTLGAALGGAGAAAFSRLPRSFLFGLSPFDPIAYAIVALLLMAVAVVACLIPARRATKVDPMVALRAE